MGILIVKFKKVGIAVYGITFGLISGLVFYISIFYLLYQASHRMLVWLELLYGIGFGILGYYLSMNQVKIICSTSLMGGFILVRSISWFVGGYPYEWELHDQLVNRGFEGIWKNYIYFGANIGMAGLGITVQLY